MIHGCWPSFNISLYSLTDVVPTPLSENSSSKPNFKSSVHNNFKRSILSTSHDMGDNSLRPFRFEIIDNNLEVGTNDFSSNHTDIAVRKDLFSNSKRTIIPPRNKLHCSSRPVRHCIIKSCKPSKYIDNIQKETQNKVSKIFSGPTRVIEALIPGDAAQIATMFSGIIFLLFLMCSIFNGKYNSIFILILPIESLFNHNNLKHTFLLLPLLKYYLKWSALMDARCNRGDYFQG